MVGGERLWRHYDLVQVTLHQLCDNISMTQLESRKQISIFKNVTRSIDLVTQSYRTGKKKKDM